MRRIRFGDRPGVADNSRPDFVGGPRYGELDDGAPMLARRLRSPATHTLYQLAFGEKCGQRAEGSGLSKVLPVAALALQDVEPDVDVESVKCAHVRVHNMNVLE